MSGLTNEQQLSSYIQYMHDEGILDHHFENIRESQNPQNPRFVARMITTFMNEADDVIKTMTRHMYFSTDDIEGNFEILITYVHQLRESTRSIGGCRLTQVCGEFHHACDERIMERCFEIFKRLKREYETLYERLSHIRQLDNSMFCNEIIRRH